MPQRKELSKSTKTKFHSTHMCSKFPHKEERIFWNVSYKLSMRVTSHTNMAEKSFFNACSNIYLYSYIYTMDRGDSVTKFSCSSFYPGTAWYFIAKKTTINTDSCAVSYDMTIYFS